MTPPTDAKLFFLKAYLDELDARIENLGVIAKAGFKAEALILCLIYIHGLASRLLWPADKNGENFVSALCAYAEDSELRLVHPLQVIRALDAMTTVTWGPIRAAVAASFPGPSYELLARENFLSKVSASLTDAQRSQLETEI